MSAFHPPGESHVGERISGSKAAPMSVVHSMVALVVVFISSSSAPAQTTATPSGSLCVDPAPLFEISDYTGPLNKLVASVARRVELKAVHTPSRQGKTICSLDAHDKFVLFVQNTLEPVTFLGAAFNAGWSQADNDDPQFGQGAAGYGKRFGAALADSTSSEFFGTFLYPFIFRQDPRYYRRRDGTTKQRLGHALTHVVIAQSDAGKPMFNYSEWFATASSISLHNLYHPGTERGFGPAANRFAVSIASDMGFTVLREFWPELSRKLKLPFRQHPVDASMP